MIPPRTHLFARSAFAEWANRQIVKVWERGWDSKPRLDPDYLWAVGSKGYSQADERSIRSEEDVSDFRLRLEKLCAALAEEAELNALGHTMAYGQLKNAIRKRHALGRLWRKQPELALTPLAPPIVVVGQMRSGTTRVQRLLAADPRLAGTRFCDSHDPLPSRVDLRPLKARAALFLARKINPWLDTMHPFGPVRTDEEIGWLSAALSPAAFEAQWDIPSFVSFSEKRDNSPIYREFARILRTDASAQGNESLPRVLKCPQFSQDLAALHDQFPDARFVHCQRERAPLLESSVSMVASQMAFQSDAHCADALRREWNRKFKLREAVTRQKLDGADTVIAHVSFSDLNDAPHAALMQVYRTLGMTYDKIAEKAVAAELARSAKGTHHQHRAQIATLIPAIGSSSG